MPHEGGALLYWRSVTKRCLPQEPPAKNYPPQFGSWFFELPDLEFWAAFVLEAHSEGHHLDDFEEAYLLLLGTLGPAPGKEKKAIQIRPGGFSSESGLRRVQYWIPPGVTC